MIVTLSHQTKSNKIEKITFGLGSSLVIVSRLWFRLSQKFVGLSSTFENFWYWVYSDLDFRCS